MKCYWFSLVYQIAFTPCNVMLGSIYTLDGGICFLRSVSVSCCLKRMALRDLVDFVKVVYFLSACVVSSGQR